VASSFWIWSPTRSARL